MPTAARDLDIVVHGATGFVGALTAARLAEVAPDDVRIGLSGRSEERLAAVREDLGPAASDWPLLEVDSLSDDDMDRLAATTHVVVSTVGPYARLGLPLVRACARAGTHYADLTGETTFMRESIDHAHAAAEASGARIVHSCGFDSIPSDLGVFLLAEHARARDLGTLGPTTLVVKALRGGASGGTIDSMRGMVDSGLASSASRRLMRDPHALSPDREAEPDNGEGDPVGLVHDADLGGWLAPFPMGIVNSRVVRRSNALTGHAWGPPWSIAS